MSARNIIRIISVAIILLFWLPWITVSCAGQHPAQFSGFEFASEGISYYQNEIIEPQTLLFIVPLSGFLVLLFSAIGPVVIRVFLQILSGLAGLFSFAVIYFDLQNFIKEMEDGGGIGEFKLESAFWFTLIGLTANIILALFQRSDKHLKTETLDVE